MDNAEILETLGTQDTEQRQTNPQHRKLQRRIPPKHDVRENDHNKI